MKELHQINVGNPVVNLGWRTVNLHWFLQFATTHIVGKPKTINNLDRRCINRAVREFTTDNIENMVGQRSNGLLTNAVIQLMEDIQHG